MLFRKSYYYIALLIFISVLLLLYCRFSLREQEIEEIREKELKEEILLPYPELKGKMSVEEAISRRRSVRNYLDKPLSLRQLSQILWAAQGITDTERGFRAAPSAGATYPLQIYVVIGSRCIYINESCYLEAGVYKYIPNKHSLILIKRGDLRKNLASAALGQAWVSMAPINIVITANYERTTSAYGERGIRYVHIEVGHVGQNIYLQATSLGLGTVAVGAFHDDLVRKIISAPNNESPLYIMPIGAVSKLHELKKRDLIDYYKRNRRD